MRILTSIIAAVLLCGCAHRGKPAFTVGKGDAGEFILRQAIARGGKPIATHGLPPITGSWGYTEDPFGVVIRMSPDNYRPVEEFLRRAFGPPEFGPTETKNGGLIGGYRLSPEGGGIQFGYDPSSTRVIVLRSMTQEEFTRAKLGK
jgi:hypothetical protein